MKRILVGILILGLSASVGEASSYRSALKKWTRHDKVYVLDNLEARLVWHATYFSEEFRKTHLKEMGRLMQWSQREFQTREEELKKESQNYDVFFISIYSGSSEWPEIGQDKGKWRFLLEVGGKAVEDVAFEKVRVTDLERHLYPYLDRWSSGYLVKFPRVISSGDRFQLRVAGTPLLSELSW